MKSVIVGTSGHIDHGKTALVRALTGIDADRLKEEKERGITIDLGFAHMELQGPSGPVRLGFVDVPGHERFVRNMLAGVGGMDLVMLVISAEDGVKPQTREHFDICRLLQVPRGLTVITKCDLVDADTVQLVRLEVEEFVRGSFLDASRSPILEVSAMTGAGLDRLRQELARLASEAVARDLDAPFRLPVDRVFTMKGFGTVVTGTTISGRLRKEQELEVLPTGRRLRVRGLQVHGAATEEATAGQRTAINLAGVAQEELERGMMLTQPGVLLPTRRLDVRLTLLNDAPTLRNRARLRLHLHTAEVVVSIKLYEGDELRPGQSAWVQLRTAQPVACAPADRFILRQLSPMMTIGGGLVADINPMRRMKAPARVVMLEQIAAGDDATVLQVLVARRARHGLHLQGAAHETGWSRQRLDKALLTCVQAKTVARHGEWLIEPSSLAAAAREMHAMVERFQQTNPLSGGISRQELLEQSGLEREFFAAALDGLVAEQKLAISADLVHKAGLRVQYKDEEAESRQQIERAFQTAGLKVPALKQTLAGLKIDQVRAQKIVTLLLREKVLVKLSDELVFHHSALEELKKSISARKAIAPQIDVTQFKELFGITRKYAIPLLEFLDRERVTRRAGDARIIL